MHLVLWLWLASAAAFGLDPSNVLPADQSNDNSDHRDNHDA